MRSHSFRYAAIGALGLTLAFAVSLLAQQAGMLAVSAFVVAAAIALVFEIGAAATLQRPALSRGLCVAVIFSLDAFILYGMPGATLSVLHGDAPAWVPPLVPALLVLMFLLAVAAHILAWRFLTPRGSAQ